MMNSFWRTIGCAALVIAAAATTRAQNLEPTVDERFQNEVEAAAQDELPALNPQAVDEPLPPPIPAPPARPATPPAPPAAELPAARDLSGPAYLGVTFDPQYRNAAVVRSVSPRSPADQAGLQPGDVIESLLGQRVRSYLDVQDVIASSRPGEVLQLGFSRRITINTQLVLDSAPGATERSVAYPPDVRPGDRPALERGPQRRPWPAARDENRDTREDSRNNADDEPDGGRRILGRGLFRRG
jgi:predicted metalloprotease with PDZ domain